MSRTIKITLSEEAEKELKRLKKKLKVEGISNKIISVEPRNRFLALELQSGMYQSVKEKKKLIDGIEHQAKKEVFDDIERIKDHKKFLLNQVSLENQLNYQKVKRKHLNALSTEKVSKDCRRRREKMEIKSLGENERRLLLTALEFKDLSQLFCQYCEDKVSYRDCAIMPSVKTKKLATLLCDSPLCMCEHLEDADTLSNEKEKKEE